MIFEVGQHYSNNNGEYIVLGVQGDILNVRYLNGQEQTLSITIQSRIYENKNSKVLQINANSSKPSLKHNSIQHYWTLGFLLARLTHLQYNIISEKEDEAKNNYFDATGEELNPMQIGVSYLREGANQWGNQGVITFRASDGELPLLKFKGKPYPVPTLLNIYEAKDINYFYFMLENGFRLGTHQDNNKIVSQIPIANKDTFNKGYNYAQGSL